MRWCDLRPGDMFRQERKNGWVFWIVTRVTVEKVYFWFIYPRAPELNGGVPWMCYWPLHNRGGFTGNVRKNTDCEIKITLRDREAAK